MAGRVLDFFPHFTTLVGRVTTAEVYVSEEFDVGEGKTMQVRGLDVQEANGPDVEFRIDTSMDGQEWREMLAGALVQGTLYSNLCSGVPGRFVRARVLVTGADGVVTLWLQGVIRDR